MKLCNSLFTLTVCTVSESENHAVEQNIALFELLYLLACVDSFIFKQFND